MTVDVSSVLKITGARIELDGCVSLDSAEFLGGTYKFREPLKVKGEIYNNGQSLTLKADVTGIMQTQCSRCLKDIDRKMDFEVHELLSRPEDGATDDSDIILFEGHEIELDGIIRESFLMNIEGQYLCDEDCKGLCPVCGANLNDGDCGCAREYIDPRWQALVDIINRQKDE